MLWRAREKYNGCSNNVFSGFYGREEGFMPILPTLSQPLQFCRGMWMGVGVVCYMFLKGFIGALAELKREE